MIASVQMKASQIPPAFIRYLKPRLQPFGRPLFWGSLSILSLLGIIIYQYGRYSNWLETNSEKITNDSLLNNNLPNQVNPSQFSPEDLAIGADIDNLGLLFQEINQNQNFPFNLSSFQEKIATKNSQDKSLNRFQVKQETKYTHFSFDFNSVSNSQDNSTDKNLLNYPISKNYPLISPINNSINPQSASPFNLITNPVGHLYLSNRQQLVNTNRSLLTKNNLAHSVNSPTNNTKVNLVPPVTNPLTTSNSLQEAAIEPKTQINNTPTIPLGNRSQPINDFQFKPKTKENINNLGQISLPISRQFNNLQPIDNYNQSEVNLNPSELQQNNLTNYQIQPLNFYQLHPSNYQLQPQEFNQLEQKALASPSNSSSKKLLERTNPINFNNSVFKSNNSSQPAFQNDLTDFKLKE